MENVIRFVPRETNHLNCLQLLRHFERYCALRKRELKTTLKVTQDLPDFKTKWPAASRKINDQEINGRSS